MDSMRILIVFSIPYKELLCYRKALDSALCWPFDRDGKFHEVTIVLGEGCTLNFLKALISDRVEED